MEATQTAPDPVGALPLPDRTTVQRALEDAMVVAQACADWRWEKRYASLLGRLEAPH